MRLRTLLAALACGLAAACAPKISDTLDRFADGINNNDVMKVAGLISAEAQDYNALRNNNWSGLAQQMALWKLQAPYGFSDLDERVSGDTAEVYCTTSLSGGRRRGYFEMRQESSFLFLGREWKIKKWKIDANDNGNFGDDLFRIQRVLAP